MSVMFYAAGAYLLYDSYLRVRETVLKFTVNSDNDQAMTKIVDDMIAENSTVSLINLLKLTTSTLGDRGISSVHIYKCASTSRDAKLSFVVIVEHSGKLEWSIDRLSRKFHPGLVVCSVKKYG